MHVALSNNGWANGRFFNARWLEVTTDRLELAVGSTYVQIPLSPSSGVEIYVEAPRGVMLGAGGVELRLDASLRLHLEASGRIRVIAPSRDADFEIATWSVSLEEPDPEPEGASEETQ